MGLKWVWRAIVVLIWCTTTITEAIWLDLPNSGTKCVSEDIHNNVVVLADYSLINNQEDSHLHPPAAISVKVTSPYGNNLYHKENITHGQFAFTTSESGNYLACFWVEGNHQGGGLSVSLDWLVGIAAKDWESVAKKEKIELLLIASVNFVKLADASMLESCQKEEETQILDGLKGRDGLGVI